MDSTYRQIFRHASVFGAGAILFRLASIVLLPLYTRYLQPSDYGIIALLDLAVNLLAIVGGAGIASAATRAHFGGQGDQDPDVVWWTAILSEIAVASLILAPAFILRVPLSAVVFGDGVPKGAYYLSLGLATLWVGSLTTVIDAYFRAQKASTYIVGLGFFRLVVNIALNVGFVVGLGMGVAGVLWGNLLSAAVASLVQAVTFGRAHHRIRFDWGLAGGYWQFGWPLVVFGLCSAAMHEADRYVLRLFENLSDVGLYSLAYQIGQGVNTLVVVPFAGIWSVLIYDIAKNPDAKATYASVFKHYVFLLALILFLAALFARPILSILAPPQYAGAADLVPIVCLAYLFFSMHEHFKVPALLASRTVALLPAVIAAASANIGLNFLLIPRMGAAGAAWASVFTFMLFSFIGLVRNRRIDRYPYPLGTSALAILGMCATYAAHRALLNTMSAPLHAALAALAWLSWVAILFGGTLAERIRRGGVLGEVRSVFSDS